MDKPTIHSHANGAVTDDTWENHDLIWPDVTVYAVCHVSWSEIATVDQANLREFSQEHRQYLNSFGKRWKDQIRPDDQIDFDTESAPVELLGALTLCRLLVFNGILPRCTWQFLPASPCLLPLCLFEDTEYWLPSYFDETFYLEIAQGSWNIVKSLKSKIPLSRFEKLLTRKFWGKHFAQHPWHLWQRHVSYFNSLFQLADEKNTEELSHVRMYRKTKPMGSLC